MKYRLEQVGILSGAGPGYAALDLPPSQRGWIAATRKRLFTRRIPAIVGYVDPGTGVLDEGILERGVLGLYVPEFDLEQSIDEYLASVEWNEMLGRWKGFVRAVLETKGNPPRLY